METTEEFMVRFRATGLDMLCEARRREEQSLPRFNWHGTTPNREPVIISGRSSWSLFPYQHGAFDRLMASGVKLVFDLSAMGTAFDDAAQSMADWVSSVKSGIRRSARIYPHEVSQWEVPKPPGRSLGPGKEVEAEGERHLNRKRIEKGRKRKKLAKKSRK